MFIIIIIIIIGSSSITIIIIDYSQQTAQAPSSYQGIFEIHEPSVIHGEPSLLESLCLLKRQKNSGLHTKAAQLFAYRARPRRSEALGGARGAGGVGDRRLLGHHQGGGVFAL